MWVTWTKLELYRSYYLTSGCEQSVVVFLLCAYVTVYMIYWKFRKTFDMENDTFRLEFLLVPVVGLSFLVNYSNAPMEVLWTFSIYLESVAILPQLFMISKTGEAETITTHYLFFLGLYRALYLANWIWRYQTENFYDQISVVSGVVQTIFYCDFFYLYVTRGAGAIYCPILLGDTRAKFFSGASVALGCFRKKTVNKGMDKPTFPLQSKGDLGSSPPECFLSTTYLWKAECKRMPRTSASSCYETPQNRP
ncbi:ER lumen protein-retaining receptor 3 [Microtus ochrogaster]|uniref:ER lumen protein-retaining receptor 3 n=1 Tax=Microtus ochrogaster TaxID=79684 RepID=A0A8J6GY15_MICOH|nr:ER lumen protein-retaining receptor 3 [Microtus ochrogaster]